MTPAEAVAYAMVLIRRRQNRKALAKAAGTSKAATATGMLLNVIDAEAAPCSVSTIAERLGVDQPRASRLVAGAVTDGLVRRESDQHDGRRSLLALTTEGAAAVEAMHAFRVAMSDRAMAGWSDHERTEFARLLSDFVARMEELSP
jgi:DNA-binding MarR family transcriptional regulator